MIGRILGWYNILNEKLFRGSEVVLYIFPSWLPNTLEGQPPHRFVACKVYKHTHPLHCLHSRLLFLNCIYLPLTTKPKLAGHWVAGWMWLSQATGTKQVIIKSTEICIFPFILPGEFLPHRNHYFWSSTKQSTSSSGVQLLQEWLPSFAQSHGPFCPETTKPEPCLYSKASSISSL